jgi:cation diffusion facilitator CzcD-associated flavoprotein CzcO
MAGRRQRVAVIGAGTAGILMGVRLERAGLDYVVYEREADVGGTWYVHDYPGLRIDVPSHVYCYSFAPNLDWTQAYPPRAEIQAYFRRVAEERGVLRRTELSTPVRSARWNGRRWDLTLPGDRREEFDHIVSAQGFLTEPVVPELPGAASFPGRQFHSSRWPADLDVRGRDVVVVGSAASAVQIVPALAGVARTVTLLQRTPNWVVPRRNVDYPPALRALFRHVPPVQRAHRARLRWASAPLARGFLGHERTLARIRAFALDHLHRSVPDPDLRAKLTPTFDPGCKRMLVTDDFYPALLRDDVRLIASGAVRVDGDEVVAADGERARADVVVYCTGYRMPNYQGSVPVVGVDGRTLDAHMRAAPEAYKGVSVPGFPNFHLVNGPNGALGYTSVITGAEMQTTWVLDLVRAAGERGPLQVRPEVFRTWNDDVQRRLAGTAWAGACPSYYHDDSGRVWTFFPGTARAMRREYRAPTPEEFEALA